MSSVHRRKIANKYRNDMDDIFYGDDAPSKAGQASTWLDALSTVAKGSAEIAQKKADADKAAANAQAVKLAQAEAQQAQSDALVAQSAAVFETDPNGPKHQAAAAAAAKAQIAVQKVAALQTGVMPMMSTGVTPMTAGKSSEKPWYFWAAIVGGVAIGGAILYRVASSSSSRTVREAR